MVVNNSPVMEFEAFLCGVFLGKIKALIVIYSL